MGLPIWRDPEEKTSNTKSSSKSGSALCAQSSIRRRPQTRVHDRHASRPRLHRDMSAHFNRPPPSAGALAIHLPRLHQSHLRERSRARYYLDRATRISQRSPLGNWITLDIDSTDEELYATTEEEPNSPAPGSEERNEETPPARRGWDTSISHRPIGHAFVPVESSQSPALQPFLAIASSRPSDSGTTRRVTLPTPPLDNSGPYDGPLSSGAVEDPRHSSASEPHTLGNSWPLATLLDGLGDRDRSPPPADGWEIFRSTITPDETLPSADSSFTSAAVSQSFNVSNDTEPSAPSSFDQDPRSSSNNSQHDSGARPSLLPQPDGSRGHAWQQQYDDAQREMRARERALAREMYQLEERSPGGRIRINRHMGARNREGTRFGLTHEGAVIDIGFRLIEEALDTADGRGRLRHLRNIGPHSTFSMINQVTGLINSRRELQRPRSSRPTSPSSRPLSPHPEQYSGATLSAVREASREVSDYLARSSENWMPPRPMSPPPHYHATTPPYPGFASFSALAGGAHMTSATTQTEPVFARSPYTDADVGVNDADDDDGNNSDNNDDASEDAGVDENDNNDDEARERAGASISSSSSTTRAASERDASDALLTGDVQENLDSMRRIVERLAARDDVPEQWWMSMGLNVLRARSRPRPRARRQRSASPRRHRDTSAAVGSTDAERVAEGRIERPQSFRRGARQLR